jgi:hypothetical protein
MGTQGSGQASGGDKKRQTSLTLKAGTNSLSGYMVASGDSGGMACNIDGVIVEGDYQGSEGDPCSAQVSVQ